MSLVRRFDHVGITVADLDAATAVFVRLGLEVEGTGSVEGEFVETVCGIPGAHCEIAMLRAPDGGSRLELASFITPDHLPGTPTAMPNEVGLRNVSFEVDDLQAALDRLAEEGYGLVGGVGQYENLWRMAYVRGPDGIIVSLADRNAHRPGRPMRDKALRLWSRARHTSVGRRAAAGGMRKGSGNRRIWLTAIAGPGILRVRLRGVCDKSTWEGYRL